MATLTSGTFSSDQEKFLASKLLARSYLKLVCSSVCDKIQQPKGAGLTANFIRYQRMNVPVATLSEGVDPAESSFSLGTVTVTLDQWGDVLTLSDVAQLTTKHPLLQQAIELLAENAARVIDREIQLVWLAGTNVQYGDASVAARSSVTSSMKMSDSVIHKACVTLEDGGAPMRGGPSGSMVVEASAGSKAVTGSNYVAICGPQVMHEVMQASTSLGSWASVAMYANQKALYNSEVGTWLNIRWVATNFIPKFTLLGNTTAAVSSTGSGGITGLVVTAVDGGGSLTSSTTYFWKITRKDLTRGFEEAISIAHSTASTATGNNESFTFALPSTAGFVYNVYFDTQAAGGDGTDAKLGLVAANQAAGATVTVTAVATGAAPPAAIVAAAGTSPGTIHPVYIHGAESCNWVSLQNLETYITKDESTTDNPLRLRRKVGYKFLAKAMIRDQSRMLRCEVASSF